MKKIKEEEYAQLLPPKVMKKWSGIEKFEEVKNEFNRLKSLNNENIVKVLDFDKRFIVMEHVDYSLEKYIKENNISKEERLKIFDQVLTTIDYLKKKGIDHSEWNIDPQNILFDRTNKKIKLIDFKTWKTKPNAFHLSAYKKKVWKKFRGFETSLKTCEDINFYYNIFKNKLKFKHVNKILYNWRINPESLTNKNKLNCITCAHGKGCIFYQNFQKKGLISKVSK